MRSSLYTLTALSLTSLAAAQSSVVTVYLMLNNRPDRPIVTEIDTTWSGAVLTAAPTATTYRLEHGPLFTNTILNADEQSVVTVVNGPSTFAQWRVHDGSSTYGEFCEVTTGPEEVYNCNVTYLGAFGGGSGYTTTQLETATNTYGSENRTFVPLAALITEGPSLESEPTAPPGSYAAEATATDTPSEGAAAQSTSAEGGAEKRAVSLSSVFACMLAAYLVAR